MTPMRFDFAVIGAGPAGSAAAHAADARPARTARTQSGFSTYINLSDAGRKTCAGAGDWTKPFNLPPLAGK